MPLIESVEFKNFKCLRDTVLPLSQFTLLVGPNGCGKSTALLGVAKGSMPLDDYTRYASIDLAHPDPWDVSVTYMLRTADATTCFGHHLDREPGGVWRDVKGTTAQDVRMRLQEGLQSTRLFSFDSRAIAMSATVEPGLQLADDGGNLASVLDNLRDVAPQRYDAINGMLAEWLPGYTGVELRAAGAGRKAIALRTDSGHVIGADSISDGSLLALAMLTLAELPVQPAVLCIEEPDRGIHPRLLREVRDAMYRLAYPDEFGEKREPVQVIATTHSPTMLDLYRDHPEEIVIAQRLPDNVKFERLSDRPDLDDILRDTPLGEAWYSGILGGVPTTP
jgi:predicted ATPase